MLGAYKLNSIAKSGARPYWSLTYQGTGADGGNFNSQGQVHSTVDSSNNVYIALPSTSPTLIATKDIIVIKTDNLGVVLWTRRVGITSSSIDCKGIEIVGSTVNVITEPTTGSYADRFMIFKLATSDGTLTNTGYTLYSGGSSVGTYLQNNAALYHSASTNFIYYSRQNGAVNSTAKYITRISSDVTTAVQRLTLASTTSFEIASIDATPGNSNPTVVAIGNEAIGSAVPQLYSFNTSSGSLNFGRQFSYTGTGAPTDVYSGGGTYRMNVKVDSSNNIYTYTFGNTPEVGILTKINSSGTVQWTRGFSSIWSKPNIVLDGTSNIYIFVLDSTSNVYYLFKFDSNGNLIFQRSLTFAANVTYYANNIVLSSDKTYLIVSGTVDFTNVSGTLDALVMKLPTDGSSTGSWNVSATGTSNVTYATSSVSVITTITTVLSSLSSFSVTSAVGSNPLVNSSIYTSNTNGLNAVKVKLP